MAGKQEEQSQLCHPLHSPCPLGEVRTTGWGHQVVGVGISHAMVIHVDLLSCGHWAGDGRKGRATGSLPAGLGWVRPPVPSELWRPSGGGQGWVCTAHGKLLFCTSGQGPCKVRTSSETQPLPKEPSPPSSIPHREPRMRDGTGQVSQQPRWGRKGSHRALLKLRGLSITVAKPQDPTCSWPSDQLTAAGTAACPWTSGQRGGK